jgi:hypothetical protein
MRRLFASIAATIFIAQCVHAAETGTVRLQGLWDNSVVYIDGKPVELKGDTVSLSAGPHQIQVEQFRWPKNVQHVASSPALEMRNLTGVYVFRLCVDVIRDVTSEITVTPLPVYPTQAGTLSSIWLIHGPVGPMGMPGKAADLTRNIDSQTAYELLREALILKIADLHFQCHHLEIQRDQSTISNFLPHFYWTGPKHALAADKGMVCMPAPPGRSGPQGLAGDVKRLKAANGELMLAKALDVIEFYGLSQDLKKAESRPQLKFMAPQDLIPNVTVYTPRWRNHLEAESAKFSFLKPEQRPVYLGYKGLDGIDGPSGTDGDVPKGQNADVRFSIADTDALLLKLTNDTELQKRVEALRKRISQLNLPQTLTSTSNDEACSTEKLFTQK